MPKFITDNLESSFDEEILIKKILIKKTLMKKNIVKNKLSFMIMSLLSEQFWECLFDSNFS